MCFSLCWAFTVKHKQEDRIFQCLINFQERTQPYNLHLESWYFQVYVITLEVKTWLVCILCFFYNLLNVQFTFRLLQVCRVFAIYMLRDSLKYKLLTIDPCIKLSKKEIFGIFIPFLISISRDFWIHFCF